MRCAACWGLAAAMYCSPTLGLSQIAPALNLPFDTVMGLYFHPAQIAFERAPENMVRACTRPAREKFWIYAQTSRPEGLYMVIAGPVWTVPDAPGPSEPILDPVDSYGEVVLLKADKCTPIGDPDTMFNAPKPSQIGIVNDLAANLIARAVHAFGGPAGFLAALKSQGLTYDKLDPILRPLVARLD